MPLQAEPMFEPDAFADLPVATAVTTDVQVQGHDLANGRKSKPHNGSAT